MPETAAPTAATADDHQLASHLAHAAGQRLLQLRRSLGGPDDSRVLRDEGDRQANELLAEGLAARLAAGEAVLSEEADDDLVRLGAGRVWIVDPLDGTREFGEPPRSDWAVHVALTAGGVPIAGAVALPALDLVLGTDPPPPPPPPLLDGPPRIAVSRTRPPTAATRVAEALGGELVPMGSAGAKAMAVVRGEADLYVHAGGQYEWDSCAPAAVALAAGLHASRLDGSPLRYNNADPYLPDLLICRPELADAAVEAAGAVETGAEAEDGTPWS